MNLNQIKRYTTYQAPSTGESQDTIIDSTYAEMAELVDNNTLKVGAFYRFDYLTIYQQLVTNEIKTGFDQERLIIQAISLSKFSRTAHSESYSQDYIEYDFNDNFCEDGITARPGFIHFRRDTDLNNSAPFDFRNITFVRYAIDTSDANLTYQQSHNYAVGNLVYDSGNMYRCRLAYTSSPSGTIATDISEGYFNFMFNLNNTKYISPATDWTFMFSTIPVNADDFFEYLAFGETPCKNVHLGYDPTQTLRFNHNVVLNTGSLSTTFSEIFISGLCSRLTFYGPINFNSIDLRGQATEVLISNSNSSTGHDVTLDVGQRMLHCTLLNSTFKLRGNASYISLFNSYVTAENGFDSGSGDTFRNSSAFSSDIKVRGVVNSNFYNCKSTLATKVNSSNGFSRFKNLDNSGGRTSTLEGLSDCNILNAGFGIHIKNATKKTFTGILNSFVYISNNNTLSVIYVNNYINVIADKVSPTGYVYYDITDDGGNITTDRIQ